MGAECLNGHCRDIELPRGSTREKTLNPSNESSKFFLSTDGRYYCGNHSILHCHVCAGCLSGIRTEDRNSYKEHNGSECYRW